MVRLSSVVLACVASLSLSGLAGAQPLSGDPFQKLTLVEKSETTTSTFTVDATGQARYTLKGPKPISETGKLSTAELAELVRDYDRSDFMTLPSDVTQVKHIMAPKVTFALWSETASDRKRIRGEPTIFTASALRVMALVTFLEKLQARIASGAAQSSFDVLTLVEKRDTTATFTVDAVGNARYKLAGPKPAAASGKLTAAELAALVQAYDDAEFATLPADVTQVMHVVAPQVTFTLESGSAAGKKTIHGEPGIFAASAARAKPLVALLEKHRARIASGAARSSFDALTLVEKSDTTATFTVDALGNLRYELAGPKPAAASGKLTAAELAALVQAYDDADFATLPADVTQVMHVMAPQVTFTLESDSTAGKKTIHGEPGIFAASAARAKPLVALLEKHRARIAASLPAPLAPTAGLTGAVGGTR